MRGAWGRSRIVGADDGLGSVTDAEPGEHVADVRAAVVNAHVQLAPPFNVPTAIRSSTSRVATHIQPGKCHDNGAPSHPCDPPGVTSSVISPRSRHW